MKREYQKEHVYYIVYTCNNSKKCANGIFKNLVSRKLRSFPAIKKESLEFPKFSVSNVEAI